MNSRLFEALSLIMKFAVYAIVPGMWFSYIAGAPLWVGAAAGLSALTLVVLSVWLVNQRKVEI